jgi:hypothetical protein
MTYLPNLLAISFFVYSQISNFQWSTGVLVHGRQNAKFISILDDQQQPIQYGCTLFYEHFQRTSVVGLTILTGCVSHNRLRMVQKKDTGEVCHVRIFADYWLINKTGIRLHYLQVRTSTACVLLLASRVSLLQQTCSCRT